MTHPIKAVIFDWAGTVIDFGCLAPVQALQAVFEAQGAAVTEAEARASMGLAKRDHVRELLAIPRVAEAWVKAKGHAPTEADGNLVYDGLPALMRQAAARRSQLIDGAAEVVADLRAAGIRIGSCTGYTREMMADILPLAAQQGYAPDVVVCAGETAEGRPSPLMAWKVLVELGIWPSSACVKVDDAEVGMGEGREAGMWCVGLAASGNGVGLSPEALAGLDPTDRAQRIAAAAEGLKAAGAHYVIDMVADLPPVLDAIAGRIAAGERP